MSSEIRKQIVEVARLMYHKNMVNAFEGNISVLDKDLVYITPSAVCKGFLTDEMLVVTDMEGNVVEGAYKPSSEIKLHLAAYRNRSDIKSVVHAHPPYATAYAVANKAIETKAYPEMIVLFKKIPLAAYGTPSTDEIWQGMLEYIQEYEIILLANHGIVTVGRDAYDAFFKLESAESIAKTLLLAGLLGGENELSPEKLNELFELRKKAGRK